VKEGMVLAAAMVLASQAVSTAQDAPVVNQQRRRERVQVMESVLSGAVRSGAQQVANRIRSGNPNAMLFTGQARARGFILEGYGIFFDVEIPAMVESVVWSMVTLERDLVLASALESLRRALSTLPNGPERMQAELAFKQVQQLGPAPPQVGPPQETAAQRRAFPAVAEPAPSAPFDPQEAYTEAVKGALIDAMLEYSLPMDLQPDEWLTVAARASEGPLRPDQVSDLVTIVLRVNGSDLATYAAADRTKRDELRSRVQVRVF
jgi:hypothetical protein